MRNRTLWYAVLAMGLVVCGCQSQDENTNWDPDTNYPDWTYDKPVYTEPAVPPKPYEKVANGIDVYYSRSNSFFVRRPGGKQPDIRPRTAVWYSFDGGNSWYKNGYYGLHQLFYTFFAGQDGHYWIRFVGPNMGVAEVPPGQPHEIHVVDTIAPQITLEVDPPPIEEIHYDCEGNEVDCHKKCCCHTKERRQHIYHVGEKINVYWTVTDVNLESKTIELSTCFARFPHNLVWSRFKGDLSPNGSLEVMIPPEAATQAGMRFRMIAHDKAGNIGLGLSEIMEVEVAPPPGQAEPEEEEAISEEIMTPEVKAKPEKKIEVRKTTKPTAKPKPEPKPEPADLPEPAAIKKPKTKTAPLGIPEPPPDLTEPVNIEKPAVKPAAKKPTTQGAITKPTPILALSETLPVRKKTAPTPVAKKETPKAVAAKPVPVKKTKPVAVTKAPAAPKATPKAALKAQPKQAKTSKRSDTSLASMEREMEKARKTKAKQTAVKPAPKEAKKPTPVAAAKPAVTKTDKPVPVKVLAKAPTPRKTTSDWKPVPPTKKTEPKTAVSAKPKTTPATMKLSDIPEKVQQGWPAKGMTMQGGISRLLNWLPESAGNYQKVELQFSSNNGKSWVTVAKDLKPNNVVTWTVPMVTSQTCLLRIVGSQDQGEPKILETSDPFRADAGKWETIDMSGFKMQVPKSK